MKHAPMFVLLLLPFAAMAQITNNDEAAPAPDGNSPSLVAPASPDDEFVAPVTRPEDHAVTNAVEDPAADAEDLGLESPGTKAAID